MGDAQAGNPANPSDSTPVENEVADARANDIANANQSCGEVNRAGHRRSSDPSGTGERTWHNAENILRRLKQGGDYSTPRERCCAGRPTRAAAQDLGAGDPLGI